LPVEIKPTAIMATNAASSVDYVPPSASSGILEIFLKTYSLGSVAQPIIHTIPERFKLELKVKMWYSSRTA